MRLACERERNIFTFPIYARAGSLLSLSHVDIFNEQVKLKSNATIGQRRRLCPLWNFSRSSIKTIRGKSTGSTIEHYKLMISFPLISWFLAIFQIKRTLGEQLSKILFRANSKQKLFSFVTAQRSSTMNNNCKEESNKRLGNIEKTERNFHCKLRRRKPSLPFIDERENVCDFVLAYMRSR